MPHLYGEILGQLVFPNEQLRMALDASRLRMPGHHGGNDLAHGTDRKRIHRSPCKHDLLNDGRAPKSAVRWHLKDASFVVEAVVDVARDRYVLLKEVA